MEGLRHRDRKAIAKAVEWSCQIKRDVVQLDEREGGLRATLNLGHTFGHAIETWQNYTGEWGTGGMCRLRRRVRQIGGE